MKKIVILFLSIALSLGGVGLFAEPAFSDVQSKPWYMDDLLTAQEWGLIPNTFNAQSLDEPITRGEFTEAAIRAYVRATGSLPTDYQKNVFTDPSSVYAELALHLGIIAGYPDNTFKQSGEITREQMFAMIYNLSTSINSQILPDTGNISERIDSFKNNFSDHDALSLWAYDSALYVVESGIVSGTGDKKLLPKAYTSRAQALVILKNAFEASEIEPVSSKKMNSVLRSVEPTWTTVSTQPSYPTSRGGGRRPEIIYTPEELLVRLGNNPVKYALIFGSADAPRYQTAAEALPNLVTVSVAVWQLDANGNKTTGNRNITVNKAIASTVKLIFAEIYEGPEQFPMKDVGGYAWRASSTSEHRWGLAIDINARENYMIRKDGTVVAGTHWKPGVDPFSMKPDGDVVTAFKKYGFTWGGDAWPMSNDYMHFSFLGE